MFKVTGIDVVSGYLVEESQPNPLRWAFLSKVGEQEFKVVTPWIKCKDFFNDYVYTYQTGKFFEIYGFNPSKYDVPKKGENVYMLLKDLNPNFGHNIEVLNQWLVADGLPRLELHEYQKTYRVLRLDPFFLKNTYNMSLIALIIRLMNDEHKFATFEEAIKYQVFPAKDQMKWNEVCAKKTFFKLPEKVQKYIWFYGPELNSEKITEHYSLPSYVHNGGVLAWGKYF